MAKLRLTESRSVEVRYLDVLAGVRYWEDADVNGAPDDEMGSRIPLKHGDLWCPRIDLKTGKIVNWPEGTTASIHYKVCDAGEYRLLDENFNVVKTIHGYVPGILCPKQNGYGDYIIMDIDSQGRIDGWINDLSRFEPEEWK